MTNGEQARRIRRIAIALGSEAPDTKALERIARLAAAMRAEMAGLFVEDINLLHLAALPFAAEFCRFTQRHRPLEGAEVERQLRIQAAAAQQALATVAERAGVSWSFRVTRGSVAALLRQAAAEVDLLALGAPRRILLHESDLALTAETARKALRTEAPGRPVVVVCDDTAAALRAVEVALHFAKADARPLTILIIAVDQEGVDRLRHQAAQLVGEQPAQYRRIVAPTVGVLLDTVRSENAAVLVLPAGKPLLEASVFKMLREGLSCPTLLVR